MFLLYAVWRCIDLSLNIGNIIVWTIKFAHYHTFWFMFGLFDLLITTHFDFMFGLSNLLITKHFWFIFGLCILVLCYILKFKFYWNWLFLRFFFFFEYVAYWFLQIDISQCQMSKLMSKRQSVAYWFYACHSFDKISHLCISLSQLHSEMCYELYLLY